MGSKVELQWVPFLYKRPCRVLYFYEPILYAPPAGPFLALPPSLVLSPLKDPTPSPSPRAFIKTHKQNCAHSLFVDF